MNDVHAICVGLIFLSPQLHCKKRLTQKYECCVSYELSSQCKDMRHEFRPLVRAREIAEYMLHGENHNDCTCTFKTKSYVVAVLCCPSLSCALILAIAVCDALVSAFPYSERVVTQYPTNAPLELSQIIKTQRFLLPDLIPLLVARAVPKICSMSSSCYLSRGSPARRARVARAST